MTIPLVLYLLTITESLRRKVFLWGALASMLLCIYKTGSRGPWIALVIALSCLALIGNGQVRKLVLMIVMTSIMVVVSRPGIRDTLENLYLATQDQDSPQGESYQWRYVLYRIANQELSKDLGRSLWGYGPESFYYLGLTTDFSVEGEMHTVKVESCDSAVVELLMDTGYVGFGLVAAFIGIAALMGYRDYSKSSNRSKSVFPALCASLLAFCFMMTNVELFGWGQQSYMLWIILAMILRSSKVENTEELEASGFLPIVDAVG
jgi:O-antigen ligase